MGNLVKVATGEYGPVLSATTRCTVLLVFIEFLILDPFHSPPFHLTRQPTSKGCFGGDHRHLRPCFAGYLPDLPTGGFACLPA